MEEIREPEKSKMFDIIIVVVVMFLLVLSGVYLMGCTATINMVHTTGSASDVVDEAATITPTVSATLRPKPMF